MAATRSPLIIDVESDGLTVVVKDFEFEQADKAKTDKTKLKNTFKDINPSQNVRGTLRQRRRLAKNWKIVN